MGNVRDGRADHAGTAVVDDLVGGIDPDEDLRRLRRAQAAGAAADHVRAILADLDRRWKTPPTAFCRELATQLVEAVADCPALLESLARLVAREIVRAALAEPRLLDALAERLAGR